MSIIVIDSLMGAGKSTYIRNYMNSHPEKRWWYIAIRLTESDIPTEGCPELNFQQPNDDDKKKSDDLLSLIKQGANISSTHQLFQKIKQTPENLDLIRAQGYTLVIDETLDTVKDLSKDNDDIAAQRAQGTFSIDEQTGKLTWINYEYRGKDFKEIMQKSLTNDVYYNGTTLISLLKADIFSAFTDIYVLTYLFNGSTMRMFFDFHGLEYSTRYIVGKELTFDKPDNYADKARIRGLISLYDGPLYDIGIRRYTEYSLSQKWYTKREYFEAQEQLFRNTYNYLHNIIKAKSLETMFTVYKSILDKNDNILPSYKKSFVECSAKATNDYRGRFNLAYLVNMYQDPEIEKFFALYDVKCDREAFARCAMLQWIWRSAVRDGKPINLFIPSPRMRRMLNEWLNNAD